MEKQQLINDERSLGDLLAELAGETGTLVRQEVALARAEVTEKATTVGKNIGFLAIGGAVAYAAVLALLAAVVLFLAQYISAWVSALAVGVVVGLVAFFMISAALAKLRKTDPVPRETVETLKEDATWLKNEMT
jgi:hypothetical protein